MGQKVIIRFSVRIWIIVCIQESSHHILQNYRPQRILKIVLYSSLYPKQLPLFCLLRLISACADRTGYITNFCSMIVLQPFRWRCVDCVIDHEGDVREE